MTKNHEVLVETIDIAAASNVFLLGLTRLACVYREKSHPLEAKHELQKSTIALVRHLARCNIEVDLPAEEFTSYGAIIAYLESSLLQKQIADRLFQQYSALHETLFNLTHNLVAAIAGARCGAAAQSLPALQQCKRIGKPIGISPEMVQECFENQSLDLIRDWVSKQEFDVRANSHGSDQIGSAQLIVHGSIYGPVQVKPTNSPLTFVGGNIGLGEIVSPLRKVVDQAHIDELEKEEAHSTLDRIVLLNKKPASEARTLKIKDKIDSLNSILEVSTQTAKLATPLIEKLLKYFSF